MERTEFRVGSDGYIYYSIEGKPEKKVTRFSDEIMVPLLATIKKDFPECYARLHTLYAGRGHGATPRKTMEARMVERFIRCNFGEDDRLTNDIDKDILNFEEVRCPLRGGFCEHEGIICKPKSTFQLSPAEKDVVDLYLEGNTFKEIAKILGKNPGTIKAQLCAVKRRLGLNSCREIIKTLRYKKY